MRCLRVFVIVFDILKKEKSESKKERKIEDIEWFVVSQWGRRIEFNFLFLNP